MEKKNRGLIVLIVVLIICIIGLVFYILIDNKIINLGSTTTEPNQVEGNNEVEEVEEDSGVTISTDNANIKLLFNNAHSLSIGPETLIYRDGGYRVSEMSTEAKMTLLASQWSSYIEHYDTGVSPNLTTTYYLDEDTLKDIYERTFGPNTYQAVNQITDGLCTTLTYDASTRRYSYTGASGCGGTTAFAVREKIIEATKYDDRIEIVSATLYVGDASDSTGPKTNYYKDYNKTKVLETVTNFDGVNSEAVGQYIDEHQDELEQYTYTYRLNEDGFYYLEKVERTQE